MEAITMRLNGWKRIGVIASVVWILGAGYGSIHGSEAKRQDACNMASALYGICMDSPTFSQARGNHCDQMLTEEDAEAYASQTYQDEYAYAAIWAFAPIPLAWLGIYLMLWLGRWVKRGFEVR